ncbi:MAG: adenylate kinase family protein [Haloarculaceae archaeon]
MRVAVTGTPGVGKTTAVERTDTDLPVVHLNDAVREAGLTDGRDEERDTLVVDEAAVADWLDANAREALVESHLAHRFPADRVIVLRCHPEELSRRLRDRGESAATAEENAESEALDLILAAAVDRHGRDRVYEIDTTDRAPDAVARAIEAVLAGDREPSAGTVDFTDWL